MCKWHTTKQLLRLLYDILWLTVYFDIGHPTIILWYLSSGYTIKSATLTYSITHFILTYTMISFTLRYTLISFTLTSSMMYVYLTYTYKSATHTIYTDIFLYPDIYCDIFHRLVLWYLWPWHILWYLSLWHLLW